jgi:hypothetical protein
MASQYSFLPWVRQGAIATLRTPDANSLPGYAKLPIALQLKTQAVGGAAVQDAVNVDLRLHGPADIIGIDPRQIIRTTPAPQTQNFLPNELVAIEFDRPDFPWLFTPAQATTDNGRLRPWLCLVVVRQQEGVTLGARAGSPLPVLAIQAPAIAQQELPNLAESWAWAHSQVLQEGPGTPALENALNQQPNLTLSRLLCPRRLEANTRYYACVVPSFEVGRKVGLNLPLTDAEKNIDQQVLTPAWTNPTEIELPVYYHWELMTGEDGDFEELAKRLTPQTYTDIGSRKLYVGNAGVPGWSDLGSVNLEGVFRPVGNDIPTPPSATEKAWIAKLQSALQASDGQGPVGDHRTTPTAAPVVGPPIYGHFQQGLPRLTPQSPPWLRAANLNVRHRAAAGLGGLLVQKLQEELMHSAWEQLQNVKQAKQIQCQQELGSEINQNWFMKHFNPLETIGFFQMSSPAHSRLTLPSSPTFPTLPPTFRSLSVQRQLPTGGTLATFRKLARAGGPIARRMQPSPATDGRSAPALVLTPGQPLEIRAAATGRLTPKALAASAKNLKKVRLDLLGQQKRWQSQVQTPLPGVPPVDAAALARMNTALNQLLPHFKKLTETSTYKEAISGIFDQPLHAQLRDRLKPASTPPPSLGARFQFTDGPEAATTVSEPSPLPHPSFPQAIYPLIQEFAADWVLPGSDRLQDNTVTILEVNAPLIEALMLGLNHEMARELLWRHYPTDQRGTYFQNFWSDGISDLKKLHEWSPTSALGSNLQTGWTEQAGSHGNHQLALVIRGELLRQFPNTIIYAVKASSTNSLSTNPSDRHYPIHRGSLGQDAMFLLFNLDEGEARGNATQPGWFFILQQQPTESVFGLDFSSPKVHPSTWSELAWTHTGIQPGEYFSLGAIAQRWTGKPMPPGAFWDFNGAHTAEIFLQRPYQLAIHGSRLLPE